MVGIRKWQYQVDNNTKLKRKLNLLNIVKNFYKNIYKYKKCIYI